MQQRMLKFLLVSGFMIIHVIVSGQKEYDSLGKDVCKCLKKHNERKTKDVLMQYCLENGIVDHAARIREAERLNSITGIDQKKLAWRVTAYLSKECEYFKKNYLPDPSLVQKREPQITNGCRDHFKDWFYYVQPSAADSIMDTTYVHFSDDICTEWTNNRTSKTVLTITWITECQFDLTFSQSNDIIKSSFSNPGDKYRHTVIDINGDVITLETLFDKHPYYFDMIKINSP